ncbi:MAG TPA: cupin domain-containing protein [Gaiellaceae bacterium]|nr:cupin domain-containing protein [Gaiellaceae bacterium]
MRTWNLHEIATTGGTRSPIVLDSDEAARAVLIGLDPGQELGDHQVKEHAFVLVLDGAVRIETGGESFEAKPGTLFTFEPDERRSVSSDEGARILLFLAPWPGPGHYRGGDEAPHAAR